MSMSVPKCSIVALRNTLTVTTLSAHTHATVILGTELRMMELPAKVSWLLMYVYICVTNSALSANLMC